MLVKSPELTSAAIRRLSNSGQGRLIPDVLISVISSGGKACAVISAQRMKFQLFAKRKNRLIELRCLGGRGSVLRYGERRFVLFTDIPADEDCSFCVEQLDYFFWPSIFVGEIHACNLSPSLRHRPSKRLVIRDLSEVSRSKFRGMEIRLIFRDKSRIVLSDH